MKMNFPFQRTSASADLNEAIKNIIFVIIDITNEINIKNRIKVLATASKIPTLVPIRVVSVKIKIKKKISYTMLIINQISTNFHFDL